MFLKKLFADKAIIDDREPILTFAIPSREGEFGLFAPNPTGWIHMVYVRTQIFCYLCFLIHQKLFLTWKCEMLPSIYNIKSPEDCNTCIAR
jgi:hypothetical protein